MVKIYGVPEGEKLSTLYTVRAGGKDVPARFCRVSAMPYNTVWPGRQRPLDQTEEAAFVSLRTDGPFSLEVVPEADFFEARKRALMSSECEGDVSAVVRPLSKGGRAVFGDGVFRIDLPGPGYYTFENGGWHNCLHIFADGPETEIYEKKAKNATYRFEGGVFNIGNRELRSNESVYIAEDAVVFGSFFANGAENVSIFGCGVIDDSYEIRETASCLVGGMRFTGCKNISVEGVTFRDSSCWTVTVRASDNAFFDRVKLIGMWRYNSDGIDIVNSSNCSVTDSFLRNFDDQLVLKGLKGSDSRNLYNFRAARCVLWCDWGRPLEIGAETCADEYYGIVFEDCDIIHGDCILMDIQNGDRASVHGVLSATSAASIRATS